MKKADIFYKKIYKDFPYQAQYIVPYAYKYRTMYSWNPRQIQYFVELRSAPQGHESYREIAQELHEKMAKKLPYFCKYI
jgi:thymidylate synthase ThyX